MQGAAFGNLLFFFFWLLHSSVSIPTNNNWLRKLQALLSEIQRFCSFPVTEVSYECCFRQQLAFCQQCYCTLFLYHTDFSGFFSTGKVLKNTYVTCSFIFGSSLPGKLIGTDWFYLMIYLVPQSQKQMKKHQLSTVCISFFFFNFIPLSLSLIHKPFFFFFKEHQCLDKRRKLK